MSPTAVHRRSISFAPNAYPACVDSALKMKMEEAFPGSSVLFVLNAILEGAARVDKGDDKSISEEGVGIDQSSFSSGTRVSCNDGDWPCGLGNSVRGQTLAEVDTTDKDDTDISFWAQLQTSLEIKEPGEFLTKDESAQRPPFAYDQMGSEIDKMSAALTVLEAYLSVSSTIIVCCFFFFHQACLYRFLPLPILSWYLYMQQRLYIYIYMNM